MITPAACRRGCSLALLAALALAAIARPAPANPHVRRWEFEGTVIRLVNEDGYMGETRNGDAVRGTFGYDLTTVEFIPDWYWSSFEFPLITLTVDHNATGGRSHFSHASGYGVGVWDEEPDFDGHDILFVLQDLLAPEGWDDKNNWLTAIMVFNATEAFSGSALLEELHLDDWELVGLEISYNSRNVFLAEIHALTPMELAGIPGDFTGENRVDARDLAVWRDVYGWEDANLAADANGDNVVDGHDFLAWQQHLGQTAASSSGATVPEPAGAALALTAIVFCRRLAFGRESRRHR